MGKSCNLPTQFLRIFPNGNKDRMLLDFFSTLPNLSLWEVIPAFLLVFMRLAPILAMAPFLGAKLAPGMARVGLGLILSLLFLPYIVIHIQGPLIFDGHFILYSLKEILIGFILGFFITIPFYIAQASGIIVDYLRGSSIMQAQDPSLQTQASPIGIFYNTILIFLFFQVDGPFLFFNALLKSYAAVSPTGWIHPNFFHAETPFWKMSFDLINQIISIAIQLSAPVLVAILMAEMFLGIANRLAPQVQIAFLGMSIKSLLGLTLLWASWFFILKQFTRQTFDWVKVIETIALYLKSATA